MKYYLTTTLKKSGGGSLCVYLLSSWGFQAGDEINTEIRKAAATDNDPIFTFVATARIASTSGGLKVTVPKVFGMNIGDWVTISLEPIGI